jgi:hypothetical protein
MIQPSAFRLSPADLPGSGRRTRCPTASYTTLRDTIPEYRFSEFDVGTRPYVVTAMGALTRLDVDSKKYVQTVTTSLSYKFNWGR